MQKNLNAENVDGIKPNEDLELWDGKTGDEWTGQVRTVLRYA